MVSKKQDTRADLCWANNHTVLTTLTNVTNCPAVGTPSVESCVWLVPDAVTAALQSMVHPAAEFYAAHRAQPRAHQVHAWCRVDREQGVRGAPAKLPRLM